MIYNMINVSNIWLHRYVYSHVFFSVVFVLHSRIHRRPHVCFSKSTGSDLICSGFCKSRRNIHAQPSKHQAIASLSTLRWYYADYKWWSHHSCALSSRWRGGIWVKVWSNIGGTTLAAHGYRRPRKFWDASHWEPAGCTLAVPWACTQPRGTTQKPTEQLSSQPTTRKWSSDIFSFFRKGSIFLGATPLTSPCHGSPCAENGLACLIEQLPPFKPFFRSGAHFLLMEQNAP